MMQHAVPAALRDRIAGMAERNPFEFASATWWVLAGVLLLFSAATDFDPSPSFTALPDWIALVMGFPILAGGVGTLIAMLASWGNLADRWRLERLALVLVTTGMTAYAVAVLWYRHASLLPAGMALCSAAGAALRVRSSRLQERRVRRDKERRTCP